MERDELRALIRETVGEVLRQQDQQRRREHLQRVRAEIRRKFPPVRANPPARPSLLELALKKTAAPKPGAK